MKITGDTREMILSGYHVVAGQTEEGIEFLRSIQADKIIGRPIDAVPGFQCLNCELPIFVSHDKIKIMNERTVLLCEKCTMAMLKDKDLIRNQRIINIDDPDNEEFDSHIRGLFNE